MPTLAPRLALCLAALPALAQSAPPAEAQDQALPEVKVKAKKQEYKPEAAPSPKITQPLLDTPQSISVVPKAVIQDQGVTTLRDTLRNVAGISLAAGEGGSQGDNLTLRGFTARNDIYLDGMRDFGSYYRDAFDLDQVEVLKGPSSMMFGRGSTGGVVNQVTKSPSLKQSAEAQLEGGSDDTRRMTADLNLPFDGHSALRLNVMSHDSDVAGRDIAENRRTGFAPSLAFGLGTDTRFKFDYLHLSGNDIPDYGVPWVFNKPAAVDMSNYYGFKDANYLRTTVDQWTAKVEHDFSDTFSVRDQLRYAHDQRGAQITEAKILTTYTPGTPQDLMQVTRNQIAVDSLETMLWNQLDFTFRAGSGPLRNVLVAGVEGGRETSDPTRYAWTGVPGTSLVDPNENQPFAGTSTLRSKVRTVANSLAGYAMDTLSAGEHWEFTGGVRWDRFKADYSESVAGVSLARTDEMTSVRGAVVFKPVAYGSVYLSYGTSFNPSAESLSLSASTADLSPEKNRTFEAGTKWDLAGGRLTLRGAIYRLQKLNARVPDPNNSALNILGGDQRVDGAEVELVGRVTERWQVYTGYAFADSEVTSTTLANTQGNPLPNAPKHTFTLWNTYDLSEAFTFGGGANFVSSRLASSTLDPATLQLKSAPGYWTFSAMAKYRINHSFEAQANLANLANRSYFDLLHPGHVVPGEGRTLAVGMTARF
ncbi:MAG TPA: TonB-dependent siderophore receptor [Holophagaceae bacterium]|nr:TonB-dependent siderophore receptor [Holophagaceae bacterium]